MITRKEAKLFWSFNWSINGRISLLHCSQAGCWMYVLLCFPFFSSLFHTRFDVMSRKTFGFMSYRLSSQFLLVFYGRPVLSTLQYFTLGLLWFLNDCLTSIFCEMQPKLVAVSNVIRFANPKAPLYPRLAQGKSWNEVSSHSTHNINVWFPHPCLCWYLLKPSFDALIWKWSMSDVWKDLDLSFCTVTFTVSFIPCKSERNIYCRKSDGDLNWLYAFTLHQS